MKNIFAPIESIDHLQLYLERKPKSIFKKLSNIWAELLSSKALNEISKKHKLTSRPTARNRQQCTKATIEVQYNPPQPFIVFDDPKSIFGNDPILLSKQRTCSEECSAGKQVPWAQVRPALCISRPRPRRSGKTFPRPSRRHRGWAGLWPTSLCSTSTCGIARPAATPGLWFRK